MKIKHYILDTESELAQKPFDEGAIYFTKDTGCIYVDPVGGATRISFSSDPIVMSLNDFSDMMAPIPNKLYFTVDDTRFHIVHNGVTYDIGAPAPVNSLDSDSTTVPLAAACGKTLKQLIDGKISDDDIKTMKFVEVTLPVSGWSAEAPYTQTVSVPLMVEAFVPAMPVIVPNATIEEDLAAQQALTCLSSIASGNGSLTFQCYQKLPVSDFSIRVPGMIKME